MAQSEEITEAVVDDHDDDEPKLFVVNTVRRWQTRGLRRRPGGKRSKFNLLLCGGKIRLLRGKSRPLPRELFEQFKVELAQRVIRGEIEIRIGGPRGELIPVPSLEELEEFKAQEVPRDDSPKEDAPEESQASEEVSEPGVEASEGGEEELDASEEEVETLEDEPDGDEELDEDEPEESEDEEEEHEIPPPSKPLDRMNKAELIDYCVQVTGMDAEDLEPMVKREILEAIQGALES